MRRRISQPRSLLLAVVALLLALVGAASASAAGWLPATPPSTAAGSPSGMVIAVDPAGDAVAAWSEDDGAGMQTLLVAWRGAGGPWSAPQPLARRRGVDARAVAIDAAGNATVVWTDSDDGVTFAPHAARRDAASGSWSTPHDFPSAWPADSRMQVRADANGNVVAAWLEHDAVEGVVFVRGAVWSGGAWSAPVTLSDPGDAWVADGPPQIAPEATGGALVAWTAQRLDAPFDYAIETRTHLGAGAWSGIGTLLPDTSEAVSPLRLAGLDDGDVAATWFTGGAELSGGYRHDAGAWNVDTLSADVAPACVPLQALGADAGGGATVAWKAASSGGLEAMRLTAGGPEPGGTLFASSTESAEDAAIDRGTVVLVAHDVASDIDSVLATRRGDSGSWSAPVLLQAADAGTLLTDLQLASDADGDRLASWLATDPLGATSLAAAAFQASAPQLTDVGVPASGTVGSALAVSAAARSTFAAIAQTSWDFGDGSSPVAGAAASHTYAQPGTYTVTVTVADAVGNTAQATRQVAIVPAPVPRPPPTNPGKPGALLRPVVGGTRTGVLALARGTRTLRLTLRNPNDRTLRGLATLTRPRSGRRPPLTLASRRALAFAPRRRAALTLRLTDAALRALKRAPGHRLRVTLTLRLSSPDGRRVSASRALTLDAARHFAARGRTPSARTAC